MKLYMSFKWLGIENRSGICEHDNELLCSLKDLQLLENHIKFTQTQQPFIQNFAFFFLNSSAGGFGVG